jgi:hypothetical protein
MKTTTLGEKIKGVVKDFLNFKNNIQEQRILGNYSSQEITELYDKVHQDYAPVFVLSTGRCGTKLLDEILNSHPSVKSFHNPKPELSYHSQKSFESIQKSEQQLTEGIDMARYELVRDTFVLGKQYVETNNRITFFAYQLAELFPKAKFIHLIREPKAFIKSGINRNWFESGKLSEESRLIRPLEGWNAEDQIEKIWWLWNETNSFIDQFKSQLDPERKLTILAEDMFSEAEIANQVYSFIGVSRVSNSEVMKFLSKKVNRSSGNSKQLSIQLSSKQLDSDMISKYYPTLKK